MIELIFLTTSQLNECTRQIQEELRSYIGDNDLTVERGENEKGCFWRIPTFDKLTEDMSDDDFYAFYDFYDGLLNRTIEKMAKLYNG